MDAYGINGFFLNISCCDLFGIRQGVSLKWDIALYYFLGTLPAMGLARTPSFIRNPLYPHDTLERRWGLRSCEAKAAVMQMEDIYLNVYSNSSFEAQEVRSHGHEGKEFFLTFVFWWHWFKWNSVSLRLLLFFYLLLVASVFLNVAFVAIQHVPRGFY